MQQQLSSDQLTVTVNYSGAEVCSVTNKSGTEFIWQADKAVWARHAPVLFPIVGKLKNNTFVFENTSYTLGQHGFARDLDFELVESSEAACLFRLRANESTKAQYPFDFIFEVSYRLENATLITGYKTINFSETPMPFSVGAHPGFNCPLSPNEKPGDYYLEFEGSEYQLTELSNGLRTDTKKKLVLKDNRLPLSPHLFDHDALVFENGQIGKISLCSLSDHKITLECPGWPYFGIWAKPGQPFVCLEPWYGIADAESASGELAEKEGMITLEPQEAFSCSFSVSFT